MKRLRVYRFMTSKRWLPVLAGGTVLQFSLTGCDPEVRNAVLAGVQESLVGLLTAMINAFFLALQAGGTTSQPVVRAVFDGLTSAFA